MTGGLELPAEGGGTRLHLRIGTVAGRGYARHIALDVGDEHRYASLRELSCEELEGLGLARSSGARDQSMAVHRRQRDGDAHLVEELVRVHRAADDERRLVEAVARRDRVAKRPVHGSSSGGSTGRAQGCASVPSALRSADRPPAGRPPLIRRPRMVPAGRTSDADRGRRGIGPAYAAKLGSAGVKNTDDLLERGAKASGRQVGGLDRHRPCTSSSGSTTSIPCASRRRSEYSDLLEAAGVDHRRAGASHDEPRHDHHEVVAARPTSSDEPRTRRSPAGSTSRRSCPRSSSTEPAGMSTI